MRYLDAVEFVRNLETNHDLMSIKSNNVSIWPLLRINLIDHLCERDHTNKESGRKAVSIVLRTLFAHNPFSFFKRHRIWLFAGFERRKVLGDYNILRISGGVVEAEPDTLVIEKPSQLQLLNKRKRVAEKFVVSESWILLLVHIFAFLSKMKKTKIENEGLLKDVLKETGAKYDYYSSIRLLHAQYKVINILLKTLPSPQEVIIECPYMVMGYVWAFHDRKIPVIEMQHGVLNRDHYAYCSCYHSNELYPDEIWCFGDDEYNYLTSKECHYCNNVEKTGLYFLEMTNRFFTKDIFTEDRKKYKKIVLVAGQRGYEQVMASFTDSVAQCNKEDLFIYVPRTTEETVKICQDNVRYTPGVNIYEYMKWCDIHLTISSTTAIECQYYHKPTVFYDYEGLGSKYYGDVLNDDNGIIYISEPNEYMKAVNNIQMERITFKECFTPNTVENIKSLLNN